MHSAPAVSRIHRAFPFDSTLAAKAQSDQKALLRSIGLAFQKLACGMNIEAALEARGFDETTRATREIVGMVLRSAQAPAMTSVQGWAAELVPTTVAAFTDVLAEQGSTMAQLPMRRYVFGQGKLLRVPLRTSNASRNLAAAFFAEGDPIRVGALQLVPAPLSPRNMGVIGTSTVEMIQAAGDGVMLDVIREGAATDTAKALDRLFYDDQPADAVRPAGLQADIAAIDTIVSTGATAADIAADLKSRLEQLVDSGFGGPRTVWIMSTLNAAVMATLFAEVQQRGTYLNIPIVSGLDVPGDVVFLVDCAALLSAQDVPVVDVATEAVLHEEDDPTLVRPIVEGAVAATPVRSLFQTNAAALKLVMVIDWMVGASGAVQTITGVAW